jgi:hypothetical protein
MGVTLSAPEVAAAAGLADLATSAGFVMVAFFTSAFEAAVALAATAACGLAALAPALGSPLAFNSTVLSANSFIF